MRKKSIDYNSDSEIIDLDDKKPKKNKKQKNNNPQELLLDLDDIDIEFDDEDDIIELNSKKSKKSKKHNKSLEFQEFEINEDDFLIDEDDFIIDLSDDNRVVISTALLSLKSNLITLLNNISDKIIEIKHSKKHTEKKSTRNKKSLKTVISEVKQSRLENNINKPKNKTKKVSEEVKPIRKLFSKKENKPKVKAKLDIKKSLSISEYIGVKKTVGFDIFLSENKIGFIEFVQGYNKDLWLSSFQLNDKYIRLSDKIIKSFINNFASNPNIQVLCIEDKENFELATKHCNLDIVFMSEHKVFVHKFKKDLENIKYLDFKEEDYEDFIEEDVKNDFEEEELKEDLKLFDITKRTYNYGRIATVAILVTSLIVCSVTVSKKNNIILQQLRLDLKTSKESGSVAWIDNFLNKNYIQCDNLLKEDNQKSVIIPYNLYAYGTENNYFALLDSLVNNIKEYNIDYNKEENSYTLNLLVHEAKQLDEISLNKKDKEKLLTIRNDYINSKIDKSQFQKDLSDYYLYILKSKVLVYDENTEISLSFEIKQETDNKGVVYVSDTDDIINQMIKAVDIENNIICYEDNITNEVNEVLENGK